MSAILDQLKEIEKWNRDMLLWVRIDGRWAKACYVNLEMGSGLLIRYRHEDLNNGTRLARLDDVRPRDPSRRAEWLQPIPKH